MTDTLNGERLVVSGRESGWLYIRVALAQLGNVRALLDRNGIRYWTDSMAVSLNHQPAVIVINLGLHNDADRVQGILDEVQ
jgi:hypothetical protein